MSHSEQKFKNRPKIVLYLNSYFGVVYHVYFVCMQRGFPKKFVFGVGVGELYPFFGPFLTLQSPLCVVVRHDYCLVNEKYPSKIKCCL